MASSGIVGPVRKPVTQAKPTTQAKTVVQPASKPVVQNAAPLPTIVTKFTIPTWAKWVGGVLVVLLAGAGIYKAVRK